MSRDNAQMRAHLPPQALLRLRVAWQRARGVDLADSVVLFGGAKLLRYPRGIHLAADVVVKSGAHLCPCNDTAAISVGARTTIGFHTFVYASKKISIGSDCMIAPFVYLVDSNHGTQLGLPMNQQPNTTAEIRVGDDVWIGAQAVILPGITIASGAVIAAGSVVTSDVAANTIVGGVPARTIGSRT